MNYKRFKKYIVVDADNTPMAFCDFGKRGGQFCYCQSEECRRPFALEVYSLEKARGLINKTIEFRRGMKFNDGEGKKYFLMPVK